MYLQRPIHEIVTFFFVHSLDQFLITFTWVVSKSLKRNYSVKVHPSGVSSRRFRFLSPTKWLWTAFMSQVLGWSLSCSLGLYMSKSINFSFSPRSACEVVEIPPLLLFIPRIARLKTDRFISDLIGAWPVWNVLKSDQQDRGRVKWLSKTKKYLISFALLKRLVSVYNTQRRLFVIY